MTTEIPESRLELLNELSRADHGWAICAATRKDGSVQASLVTAGVMTHPVEHAPCAAFVVRGQALKLRLYRRTPRATVTFRAGPRWVTVEGAVTLIGPDDPHPSHGPGQLPQLMRDVFTAAGGTHDDWDTFDRVMAEERRCAVFVTLDRVYTSPGR